MLSKSARWLVAASLLALATSPSLAGAPAAGGSEKTTGKGWLGVTSQSTDADLKKGLGLTQDGLLVNGVTSDGPADRAGLRRGDVILTYNSRSVTTPEQLRDLVRSTAPGRSVALGIWRDGAKKTLDMKVGDVSDSGDMDSFDAPVPPEPPAAPRAPKPPTSTRIYSDDHGTRVWVDGRELDEDELNDEIKDKLKDMKVKLKDMDDMDGHSWNFNFDPGRHVYMAPMARTSRGRLGIRIDELNSDMGQALGVPSGAKGVLVTQVLEDTPAQKAGIRAGDVIVRLGGDAVNDTDDLTQALRDRQGKVSIELLRKGAKRTVDVDIPSRESSSRSWSRIPEPAPGYWGYWKSKDSADGDADLRREIEDLKKEIQELREQMKSSKK